MLSIGQNKGAPANRNVNTVPTSYREWAVDIHFWLTTLMRVKNIAS